MSAFSEADDAMADAYRRQAAECRAAMHAVLAGGWTQAAAILAVQAVRSAANALLAAHVKLAATGQGADPVGLLYELVPPTWAHECLIAGAEVTAYDEDLHFYGFALEPDEVQRLVLLAERFCAWAAA